MVETRSSKRRRLIYISSHVSPRRSDLPAIFESLNDDTLTTVLEFVGDKSYRSFGGVNKHCKEVYITNGMAKETFVYGYAPLLVIIDKIERAIEDDDWKVFERVGKGVVLYNRKDVLDWALEERKKYVLQQICNVAAGEGRIDLLDEVLSYMNDSDDKRDIFHYVGGHAARGGKLNVLKWYDTKGFNIDKGWCALQAARYGRIHILQWLREEQGFELDGNLYQYAIGDFYYHSIDGGQLHVMKWLREQEVDWGEFTFYYAAYEGNLDILQWLHDEGCSWPYEDDDEDYCVREEDLKAEVIDWLRVNGYSDRIISRNG